MIKKLMQRLLPACILAGGLLFGVMVVFARADTPIVDLSVGEEDFRVVGESALDWMGEMTTGDINADGIPDLIVGASGYDITGTPPITDAGAVYVIFGSPNLSGTLDLNTSAENADIVIYGHQETSAVGHVVASGDLNGDGYVDIVIGASAFSYGARLYAGAVFVIYGPITESVSAPIYLNDSEWIGLTVYGAASSDRFGRAVAVGDVNGDGVDDLVGGAYQADRSGSSNCGRAYVLYGGEELTGTIDLNTTGTADVTIIGTAANNRLGRSVATGDVDGDGVADLIIGMYSGGPGEVVLIYGSDTLSATIDLYTNNITGQGLGLRFRGANTNDGVGFYVATGNVNGDQNPNTEVGYADILVGAYFENFNEDGIGYVLHGGPEITAGVTITSETWTVPISVCADLTLYPADIGDRLGRSMASGDLNADGYDDLIIGASRADPDDRTDAGETYVFYGSPHLSGTITISPTGNTDLTVLGHRLGDEAGRSSATGDLNGDGVPDLIVGAVMATPGDDYGRGEVYAIWGPSATAISLTASSDVLTAGQPATFTVMANNRYSQTWNVTGYTTTYTMSPAAGGVWGQNYYTTEIAGVWVITAAHRELTATTVITVVPDTAAALSLSPPAASILAGDAITYSVVATDTYGNSWDATETATYTIDPEASGSWDVYTYTSALAGRWAVTATYQSQNATAVLTVVQATHLTIATAGVGSGNVTPTVGTHAYAAGTLVTLTAMADEGSIFDGWSGDIQGMDNPYTVTLDASKLITAVFTRPITRSVVATGTISFAPLPVTIVVEDRGPDNCLTEVSVTQFEKDHPYATVANLQTGRYWAITQKDCGPGEVFTATLNLPLGSLSQEDSPKLCRWTDEGWDCAEDGDHIVGTDSITRTNIHAFSLWTVGYKVSPTALTVSGLTARGAIWGAMFGSLLVLVAVALHLPRKRRRR